MKTSIYFLNLLFLLSCSFQPNEPNQRELVPHPEKYEHDGYSDLPDSLKPHFVPDTSIGLIGLLNSTNVDEYLGKNSMGRLIENAELPYLKVISRDKKQVLTIFFHPGGVINEFSEFQVRYYNSVNQDLKITQKNIFESENKIKLGITVGDLRSIKGEPYKITTKQTTCFYYKIDDYENSEFLNRYNYPSYYANYEFKNGYLIEFSFGFEYP